MKALFDDCFKLFQRYNPDSDESKYFIRIYAVIYVNKKITIIKETKKYYFTHIVV